MWTREHTLAGQLQRLIITRCETGWEVREEHDSEVIRTVRYDDWHRVERRMQVFELRERLAS